MSEFPLQECFGTNRTMKYAMLSLHVNPSRSCARATFTVLCLHSLSCVVGAHRMPASWLLTCGASTGTCLGRPNRSASVLMIKLAINNIQCCRKLFIIIISNMSTHSQGTMDIQLNDSVRVMQLRAPGQQLLLQVGFTECFV
jgi:hypothetical protein